MIIQRELYLNQLIDRMHNGMIKVITGLRRSGKSFLLNNLFYEYLKSNGIDKMPFAASADLYAEVRSHYASLMKGKALPEAMVVHRYEEPEKKVEKELTPEEKTLKLFGAENVEIIEGDK